MKLRLGKNAERTDLISSRGIMPPVAESAQLPFADVMTGSFFFLAQEIRISLAILSQILQCRFCPSPDLVTLHFTPAVSGSTSTTQEA